MSILLPILSPLNASLLAIILISGPIGLNYIEPTREALLPLEYSLLTILMLFIANVLISYFVQVHSKQKIIDFFSQYIPSELVHEMSHNSDFYSLEAEERQMTVLFSDVRNFTTISEMMKPKELSALMNEFLTALTATIHDHRGTIDKYMGDAIMAFWGAPIKDPRHAQHALQAAIVMIEKLETLSSKFIGRGWPEIKIGIGINTGEMRVGNMGSEFRMAYTIMGDAVNLGSRLENATKHYGVPIVVGEATVNELPDYIFRKLAQVRVKGKMEGVIIFEPVAEKAIINKDEMDELEKYEQALMLYRNQDWDKAMKQFQMLQEQYIKRHLYEVYLARIEHFQANPPGEDWDGVYSLTTK